MAPPRGDDTGRVNDPRIDVAIQADPIVLSEPTPPASSGAVVTFVGYVRSNTQDREVVGLDYEAFEELALPQLTQIATEAADKWDLDLVKVIHRTGSLAVGESSVLVEVSSAHRSEAFDACREIIDTLKETAAIWKKEIFADGTTSWVNHP